jgi:hypothetical protein
LSFIQCLNFPLRNSMLNVNMPRQPSSLVYNRQKIQRRHVSWCVTGIVKDWFFFLADLLNANNELLGCFKSYDEMIEQQLMHQAQLNSQSLHHRGTTQVNGTDLSSIVI